MKGGISKGGTSILLSTMLLGCASSQVVPAVSGGEVALVRTGEVQLRQDMRRLWADHVIWTRGYIVAAIANDPSASTVANRLLRNQDEIGNSIVPYYGAEAGKRLGTLLRDHITIAVELVAAAKAGDKGKMADVDRRWHENANEIATFLSGANPNWPKATLVSMLNEHLSLTTQEATARLEKRWGDDVQLFDRILTQAMHMADALTDGIVKQFPSKV